jgi:hypothetical protein
MTFYPSAVDDDTSLVRIDDNISELGDTAINQLREAVFAIEQYLGLNPQGALSSLSNRMNISINADGTIKSSALSSVGLVTLPITNVQVASNAGIDESKLNLTYTTPSLYSSIGALTTTVTYISTQSLNNWQDIRVHVNGGLYLSDLTTARHLASYIDLDTFLVDKTGANYSATTVWLGLYQINQTLNTHQNAVYSAHPATAITVDASGFTELSTEITNVQEALTYIDDIETKSAGFDRATLSSNGIVRETRNQAINMPDGYSFPVVPETTCYTYLGKPIQVAPNDSDLDGDDVIIFVPVNTNYVFDSQFTNVVPGDIIRVNYLNGVTGIFEIAAVSFYPDNVWKVRINGINLVNRDGTDGYVAIARIDRPQFDTNTRGVLACAPAETNINPAIGCTTFLSSVIVGSQRGATAVGLALDPAQLDGYHYNLYLRLYPTGDSSVFTDLYPIDVTGNMGASPGYYNLDIIIESCNKSFRAAGFNYRFIAFNHKGQFGLMLADAINNASFSIISGAISNTSIITGTYTNNVIGASDGYDALGFGASKAGLSSPVGTFTTGAAAAGFSTIIISPIKQRNSIINGVRRDFLPAALDTNTDGYFLATITGYNNTPTTKTIDYTIYSNLLTSSIKPGKTIVVQPIGTPTADGYNLYGRFIVGSVVYTASTTIVKVVNGLHNTVDAIMTSFDPRSTDVRIYVGSDSVTFDVQNMDASGTFHRYHEIMADQLCNTFAIERACMSQTAGDTNFLNTALPGWRIRRVSPKLKGYLNSVNFTHWIRFVVSSYNTTTGEFEGYLAQASGSYGVVNPGPTVKGLKNHPVRFYDNSYVNYIDIEFRETATATGTPLLSGTIPQVADIQIFPGLSEDSENFVLAGVSHNDRNITSITDLREFGTVSERNFSDSALAYIETGERYLHANGVVRGFEYITSPSPGVDGILSFTGGCALVDGKFVNVDAGSVKIPKVIIDATYGVYHTAFICVNKDGNLAIVLKSTGTEIFAYFEQYFVESLTFKDIIDNRKDLCVIAQVKYLIAQTTFSITDIEVKDARRFVTNESINDFTLCNDGTFSASFHTLRAVEVWSDEYEIPKVKIKSLTLLDSYDYYYPTLEHNIIFEGGVINITGTSQGFWIRSSNFTLKDCVINYEPSFTLITGDIVNCVAANAAIVLYNYLSNITLENNSFYSSLAINRPPFIGYFSSSSVLDNIKIVNNNFTDTTCTENVAIAFVATDVNDDARPTLSNCIISGNIANNNQTLFISSRTTPNPANGYYSASSGVIVDNVIVENNKFGAIGLLISGGSIIIQNNTADVIATGIGVTLDPTATALYEKTYGSEIRNASFTSFSKYNTPEIKIIGNNVKCNIRVDGAVSGVYVNSNTINRTDLDSPFPKLFFWHYYKSNEIVTVMDMAISIMDTGGTGSSLGIQCCNNTILAATDCGYQAAVINLYCYGNINNNTLNNCFYEKVASTPTSIGIYQYLTGTKASTIVGNSFIRGDTDIVAYIDNKNTCTNITGNSFDKFWVKGLPDASFSTSPTNFSTIKTTNLLASHNINQTTIQDVNLFYSSLMLVPVYTSMIKTLEYYDYLDPSQITTYIPNLARVKKNYGTSLKQIYYDINADAAMSLVGHKFNLREQIPAQAVILGCSFSWGISSQAAATSELYAGVYQNSSGLEFFTGCPVALDTLTLSGTVEYTSSMRTAGARVDIENSYLAIWVKAAKVGTYLGVSINDLKIMWCY